MKRFGSSCFASGAISPPPPCASKKALSLQAGSGINKYPPLISAGNGLIFWSLSVTRMNVTGVNCVPNGVRGEWETATRGLAVIPTLVTQVSYVKHYSYFERKKKGYTCPNCIYIFWVNASCYSAADGKHVADNT
jgi:hypothetical protein